MSDDQFTGEEVRGLLHAILGLLHEGPLTAAQESRIEEALDARRRQV